MLRKLVFALFIFSMATSVWASTIAAGQGKVTICHKLGTRALDRAVVLK